MQKSLIAAAFAATLPASAEQPPVVSDQKLCAPTNEVIEFVMGEPHKERPFLQADNNDGSRLDVFMNPETRTFTAVVTPDGSPFSCVVGAGKNMRPYAEEARKSSKPEVEM